MAAALEVSGEVVPASEPTMAADSLAVVDSSERGSVVTDLVSESNSPDQLNQPNMGQTVRVFPNVGLNPMAEEFVPSRTQVNYNQNYNQMVLNYGFIAPPVQQFEPNTSDRRNYRNVYSQDRRFTEAQRSFGDLREDRNRAQKTVYISEVDNKICEEDLAMLFSVHGHVMDCRVCGDPFSNLRFAFVEFSDEDSAREALRLSGIKLGSARIRVMPSKTAIQPIDSKFLPQSEEEEEKCARTICCTNIDKQVTQADVKSFFEARCGEVSLLRLLGDRFHSTRIAFIEFVTTESAVMALDCCGMKLGGHQLRVNPSKTPVRPRVGRSFQPN